MTEAEWDACADPTPMLERVRGKVSDRKLRLFACACCRTAWSAMSAVFQEAIRVAEEHADGRATNAELGMAVSAAHRVRRKRNDLERAVYDAARSRGHAWGVMRNVAYAVARAAAPNPSPSSSVFRLVDGQYVTVEIPPNADQLIWNAVFASHLKRQASLLRDVVGLLPPRTFNLQAGVLDWNDGTVRKMAQAIYDGRAFDQMPLLADALEEAGCDDPDVLAHCRPGGEHVRGCWVVDLLLGKS